jgi:serine protease Do
MRRALMIAACAAAVPASGVCEPPAARAATARGPQPPVISRVPAGTLAQLSDSLQQLASKVSPAVVQIEVAGFGRGADDDRRGAGAIVRQRTIGAGVILDADGYIMTNAHVVEGAQRIRVMLSQPAAATDEPPLGRFEVLEAKVVGSEELADLALLKVEACNLPALALRLDRPPQPGELVFAIGSPGGLRNSVTMGVISAWRQPDPDSPLAYLQTDAPISPGSSGGPLVDVTGAVVGLNTFVLDDAGRSEGLGFAIPARVVDFMYRSLRKYGHVDHVDLGVVAQTVTPMIAEGLGLTQDWGVVIADVMPGGPADAAGLQPGDVLLTVDGYPMLGLPAFTAALYQHPAQQTLKMEALRGTQTMSFAVPGQPAPDHLLHLADLPDPVKSHIGSLGILALDVDDRLRQLLPEARIANGVVVLGHARGFESADTGLRVGDVIHSLNRRVIESVDQLKSAAAELKRGDPVVLRVERRGQLRYLSFEME